MMDSDCCYAMVEELDSGLVAATHHCFNSPPFCFNLLIIFGLLEKEKRVLGCIFLF